MFDLKLPTHRRGFLGSVAATAAAAGLSELVPHSLTGQDYSTSTGPAQAGAKQDPALTAWLGKIRGKHRIVYDAPEPNHGFAFAWSRVFYMTNTETGVPEGDVGVVVILRHNAIPFAMADAMWDKYKFGETFSIMDPASNAASVHNFLYKAPAGALPIPGMGIDELLASGVLMGVCHMAIKFFSGVFAKKMNMSADDVRKDWLANLLPGIQVVPSGVWAVNRAQERGCGYCFAG